MSCETAKSIKENKTARRKPRDWSVTNKIIVTVNKTRMAKIYHDCLCF